MKLTKDIILYFIHPMNPDMINKRKERRLFSGIRQLIPGEVPDPDYLYACTARQALEEKETIGEDSCLIILFSCPDNPERILKKLRQLPSEMIVVNHSCSLPVLMNLLNDIFCRLIEWDKDMHIAVLEGADVQKLLDISEKMLGLPMISFDGSFNVIAYTKNTKTDYRTYNETVRRGYTDSSTMNHLTDKNIFSRINDGPMLIAKSADDDRRNNIYLQFFNGQTLLGYTAIFCEETIPEPGYLDLVGLFMKNMSFCMNQAYENERHGRMMYETFLTNLLQNQNPSKEQYLEQLRMINGLYETGTFVLGLLDFEHRENIPLKFLINMFEKVFVDIRLFLFEKRICMLKITNLKKEFVCLRLQMKRRHA